MFVMTLCRAFTCPGLAKHVPLSMPQQMKRFSDVAIKANVLLQSHFSRRPLTAELRSVIAGVLLFCCCGQLLTRRIAQFRML